jgi:hypothetical protein
MSEHILKIEVQGGVVVTVVKCSHCDGTGSCNCDYCAGENFGHKYFDRTSGGYNKSGPCDICNGSGTKIITKKL